MLPDTTNPAAFRAALRAARKAAGLTYSDLARLAGISPVMPARYEKADHSNATLPTEITWEKLNKALFPSTATPSTKTEGFSELSKFSIDQIVAELKRRGAASVSINW